MTIKSRTITAAAREPQMPVLMETKRGGLVVLARVFKPLYPPPPSFPGSPSAPVTYEGVVLSSTTEARQIGDTIHPLNLGEFEPFTGALTLEN